MNKQNENYDVIESETVAVDAVEERLDEGDENVLNDAQIIGEETPEMAALLEKEFTFLTGEMWGQRDRRNTQDGQWVPRTMPLHRWIDGGEGDANNAPWGFSRHPEGRAKEGSGIVLGTSIGKSRKSKAMSEMYAMGIDVDSGATLENVIDIVKDLGLFCIVYTSFNHGKAGIELKRDEVMRKMKLNQSPTLAEVKDYLRDHDKNLYEPEFIDGITIKHDKKQVKEGVVIVLDTPPLDKFRLIFPLQEEVKLIDLAETQGEALEAWENKITGLAHKLLGINFDTSCTDPSRLFYTARHPKNAEWDCLIVQGKPLRFEDVPSYKKSSYTAARAAGGNPFLTPGGGDGEGAKATAVTPGGRSLMEWHSKAKARFQIADFIEDHCPDKIRVAGGEKEGHLHIECPFEHEHSSEGGTGTMVINASDSESGYWTWFCHHDACQGRQKTDFLNGAIQAGWFSEEDLFTEDERYYLLPEDDVVVIVRDDIEQACAALTRDSAETAITDVILNVVDQLDTTGENQLVETIATATSWNKNQTRKALKQAKKAARRSNTDAISMGAGYRAQIEYVAEQIARANKNEPQFFSYADGYAVVQEGRVVALDRDAFFSEISKITTFEKDADDNTVDVAPPDSVIRAVFKDREIKSSLPKLKTVKTSPFFAADGALVDQEGYHATSETYLFLGELDVPRVSAEPSAAEVQEAKRLLVEEVLGDFPFGGLSRDKLVPEALGAGVPALANALALILLPFVREMIDGPTAGHIMNKNAPGTGASLLTDVCSIIAQGHVTPAQALPRSDDEMNKLLASTLLSSPTFIFFDNINDKVDSGTLASAMTAVIYQARLLGHTQVVSLPVRGGWIFTANTLAMSGELVRRCVLIDLDANMSDPTARNDFRHADIRGWVRDHRDRLVWACLTLVQNYVAKGQPQRLTGLLASFEQYSRVMGGILEAAGVKGFMGNREKLADVSDGGNDDIAELVQEIAVKMHAYGDGATLFAGSQGLCDNAKGRFGVCDVLNSFGDMALHDWGYDRCDDSFEYNKPRVVGAKFKQVAARVHRVELDGIAREVKFIPKTDRSKKACYHMEVLDAA